MVMAVLVAALALCVHAQCGATCGQVTSGAELRVNTHFGEIMSQAPKGICCPSRRAAVVVSPTGVVPVRYGGAALLQDSRVSLGVTAAIDESLFAANDVVQMRLYAFDSSNCADNGTSCSFDSFFLPGTSVPRPGNAQALLQSTLVPASRQLSVSSFATWPLASPPVASSIGLQLWICFSSQGQAASSSALLAAQLYGPPASEPCGFRAVFPARVSY